MIENIRKELSMIDTEEEKTTYNVVMNHEEQYSIWPVGRPHAPGWTEVGISGTRQECLAHIKEVWTDMRPLSLREAMAKQSAG